VLERTFTFDTAIWIRRTPLGRCISWIGFRGTTKDQILARLGLRDTGEPDEYNEEPVSGAEIPGGWYVVFSNDIEFVSLERLARLSRECLVVACQAYEGMMISSAYCYENGADLWTVIHDSNQAIDHLFVDGTPPPEFEAIRDRLTLQQREEGAKAADDELGVDYVFNIPIETAAIVCPYRYDEHGFDWGEPNFTRLEAVESKPAASKPAGLLSRLFGKD
jgi:hypothetical protein